eukprot:scaffold224786_cov28-Prasinocladus_malaysianus.AAC.1
MQFIAVSRRKDLALPLRTRQEIWQSRRREDRCQKYARMPDMVICLALALSAKAWAQHISRRADKEGKQNELRKKGSNV